MHILPCIPGLAAIVSVLFNICGCPRYKARLAPNRIEHMAENALSPAALTAARTVYIKSYGCQMNVYDAIRMGELLGPHGWRVVETPENADMVILNTCHIREKADEKVFSDLGRLRTQAHEEAIFAVGGCMGQAMGKQVFARAPFVEVVFGPQTYHRLPEFIEQARRKRPTDCRPERAVGVLDTDFPELEKFDVLPSPGAYGPTAFVSIQ